MFLPLFETTDQGSSSRLALQVLRSIRLHELRADTVSVNSAMGACGGDGNWQMAELWNEES